MSVARNTFYLTAASIAQKVIAFVYFTVLANHLGAAQTGEYFLALSLVVMFSIFADWGITSVIIRDIATHNERATQTLREAIGLKLPLTIFSMLTVVGFSLALGYDAQIVRLVALATPILAADGLSTLFYGVLRGQQNLRYEAVGIFVGQFVSAALGAIVLLTTPRLELLILTLLVGSLWNAFFAGIHVAKRLGRKALLPYWSLSTSKMLLRTSMAFGLAGLFVKIYSSIDSILLSLLETKESVGIYAVAYKLTYAFQFLPMAFVGAIYPAMSSFFQHDKERLRQLFDHSIWYMAILAVPITFGIASTADLIIPLFYPNGYAASVPALQILVFVLLFIFLDFPVGSLLNAAHRQGTKTAVMGATMVVNTILNLLLIPRLGVVGACWAAVASFIVLFVASFWFVRGIIPYGPVQLFRRLIPILFSGILMSLVVLILKPVLHLFFLIPIAGIVYVLALFLLRGIRLQELKNLKRELRPSSYAQTNPVIDA